MHKYASHYASFPLLFLESRPKKKKKFFFFSTLKVGFSQNLTNNFSISWSETSITWRYNQHRSGCHFHLFFSPVMPRVLHWMGQKLDTLVSYLWRRREREHGENPRMVNFQNKRKSLLKLVFKLHITSILIFYLSKGLKR